MQSVSYSIYHSDTTIIDVTSANSEPACQGLRTVLVVVAVGLRLRARPAHRATGLPYRRSSDFRASP